MIASSRLDDSHVCPMPEHGTTPIVTASSNVIINGTGAARVGDVCGCGAVITTGFPSVLVNGRPLAHVGSLTSHGGTLVSGSGNTFGGSLFAPADGSVDESRMATLLADPALTEKPRRPMRWSARWLLPRRPFRRASSRGVILSSSPCPARH